MQCTEDMDHNNNIYTYIDKLKPLKEQELKKSCNFKLI